METVPRVFAEQLKHGILINSISHKYARRQPTSIHVTFDQKAHRLLRIKVITDVDYYVIMAQNHVTQ